MVEVINHRSIKKARKTYTCDSCIFLTEYGSFTQLADQFKMTFSEKRSLVKAKQSRQMIEVGDPYVRQFNKMDGEVYVWRAIPEIHAICCKYDLYSE